MSIVTIIGSGMMGSALSYPLKDNNEKSIIEDGADLCPPWDDFHQ